MPPGSAINCCTTSVCNGVTGLFCIICPAKVFTKLNPSTVCVISVAILDAPPVTDQYANPDVTACLFPPAYISNAMLSIIEPTSRAHLASS